MSATTTQRNGSVGRAFVWMTVLSLLFFWMPVFGPFVAGLVGGSRAGGVGNAVLAALMPAILVGLLLAVGGFVIGLPIIGGLFAAVGAGLAIAHSVSMLAGALVGAALLSY
jgi:hypothetical protein